MTEAIEPSTWTTVLATIAGAALLIISAGVPIALSLLRNLKAQLDIQYKELQRNTATTAQVEQQANGLLAAARNEAQKWRSTAERMDRVFRRVGSTPEGRAMIDRAVHDSDYDNLLSGLMNGETKK